MRISLVAMVILLGVALLSGCMGQSEDDVLTTTPATPEEATPLSAAQVTSVKDAWDRHMPLIEQTFEDLEEQFGVAVEIARVTDDASDLEGLMTCYKDTLVHYLIGTSEHATATVLLEHSSVTDDDMLLIDRDDVPFTHPDGSVTYGELTAYAQQRVALETCIDDTIGRLGEGDATNEEAMALFETYFSFRHEYAAMVERSVYTELGTQLHSQSLEHDVIVKGCDPHCIGCRYYEPPEDCTSWVLPAVGSPYSAAKVAEIEDLWTARLPGAADEYEEAKERVETLLEHEGTWSQWRRDELRTALDDYVRHATYQAWGTYHHTIVATMLSHTVSLENDMLCIRDDTLVGADHMGPDEIRAHDEALHEELASITMRLELLVGTKEWDDIWATAMRRTFSSMAEWYEDYKEVSAEHARDTVMHMLVRQGAQQRILALDCEPECAFLRYGEQYPAT